MVPAADLRRGQTEGRGVPSLQQYVEDTDWHRMANRRVTTVRANLMQPSSSMQIVVFAILLDAHEIISDISLPFEQQRGDLTRAPHLMAIHWDKTHFAIASLQFYALGRQWRESCIRHDAPARDWMWQVQ